MACEIYFNKVLKKKASVMKRLQFQYSTIKSKCLGVNSRNMQDLYVKFKMKVDFPSGPVVRNLHSVLKDCDVLCVVLTVNVLY